MTATSIDSEASMLDALEQIATTVQPASSPSYVAGRFTRGEASWVSNSESSLRALATLTSPSPTNADGVVAVPQPVIVIASVKRALAEAIRTVAARGMSGSGIVDIFTRLVVAVAQLKRAVRPAEQRAATAQGAGTNVSSRPLSGAAG